MIQTNLNNLYVNKNDLDALDLYSRQLEASLFLAGKSSDVGFILQAGALKINLAKLKADWYQLDGERVEIENIKRLTIDVARIKTQLSNLGQINNVCLKIFNIRPVSSILIDLVSNLKSECNSMIKFREDTVSRNKEMKEDSSHRGVSVNHYEIRIPVNPVGSQGVQQKSSQDLQQKSSRDLRPASYSDLQHEYSETPSLVPVLVFIVGALAVAGIFLGLSDKCIIYYNKQDLYISFIPFATFAASFFFGFVLSSKGIFIIGSFISIMLFVSTVYQTLLYNRFDYLVAIPASFSKAVMSFIVVFSFLEVFFGSSNKKRSQQISDIAIALVSKKIAHALVNGERVCGKRGWKFTG